MKITLLWCKTWDIPDKCMSVTRTSSSTIITLSFMTGAGGSDLNLLKDINSVEDHKEMQPAVSELCVWQFTLPSFGAAFETIRGQIWEVMSGIGPLSCAIMALIIQGSYFKPLIWKWKFRRRQGLLVLNVYFFQCWQQQKQEFPCLQNYPEVKSLYYPSPHSIFYCCLYLFMPWEICKH